MARVDEIFGPTHENFPPTADGIRRWVDTTDPTPSREEVLDHVRFLRTHRLIEEKDVESLAADYPELAGL